MVLLLFNQGAIECAIPSIRSIYFYLIAIIFFNYGLLLLGINYNTMGCGIVVIGCSLANFFYGFFDKTDKYIEINDNVIVDIGADKTDNDKNTSLIDENEANPWANQP
jgi:hypothetical protein